MPFVQIDPILPVQVRYVLHFPDGRQKVAEGFSDRFGSFVGTEPWKLDQEGVYRYQATASWQGFEGHMPGLPREGGFLFVKNSAADSALGMRLSLPEQQSIAPDAVTEISGFSNASEVFYTILTPGAVIGQGKIGVKNGRFSFAFDPVAINKRIPIYDVQNRKSGRKELGRVIHLTCFSHEKPLHTAPFYSFKRVIIRRNTLHYTN